MPVTYPRDLRILHQSGVKFRSAAFRLVPRIATASLPNRTQVMEVSPAVWTASFQTVPLTRAQHQACTAFLDSLKGAKSFVAFPPFRKWPLQHRLGGIAQTVTVSAITATRITLSGASGITLSEGDLIGLEQSGKYGLFRCLETVPASAGVIAMDVAPSVPSFFTTSAVARLNRPLCEMILDPSDLPDSDETISETPISFRAVQKVS